MKAYFEYKGIRYKAEIIKTNSPSNYNHFAAFYKTGERTALLGYAVKATTTMKEVINHFKLSYERYMNQQLLIN